jgi:hypothetical protein
VACLNSILTVGIQKLSRFYRYSSKNKKNLNILNFAPHHPINTPWFELIPHTFHPVSSPLYIMLNNWSPNLQMWCDLLNTPTSQAPPIPDELADASPLHRRSNASSTPLPHTLFQPPPPQPYHYSLYQYPTPPVGGSSDAPPTISIPSTFTIWMPAIVTEPPQK